MKYLSFILILSASAACVSSAEELRMSFTESEGEFAITVNDRAIASYVYDDTSILRPYFAHVKAPGGIQVTRNHPPESGDKGDHATMHPGIWLAFGALDGSDFWRNKATVRHVKFIQSPLAERNVGSFIEQKRYVRTDGSVVCDEELRVAIRATDDGYSLFLESVFRSENAFAFGDQEEMGLGIRVATPMSEIRGGELTDSTGRHSASEIWSNSAAWCDYSGRVDGQNVGMTIMCHPTNFRESWWHARDYGLLVANPFGRAAMHKGEASRVIIKPGEELILRFAIWVHGNVDQKAIQAAYNDYSKLGQ